MYKRKGLRQFFDGPFLTSTTVISFVILVSIFSQSWAQLPQDGICPSYACPKIMCALKLKDSQKFCENVKCVGIHVSNCTSLSSGRGGRIMYEEHLSMCGCCPGCVRYLAAGESCDQHPPDPSPDPDCTSEEQFCPILMHRCAPGLTCPLVGPSEKKCTFKANTDNFAELTSCHDRRALRYIQGRQRLHWLPVCDSDGNYAPKQCKTDEGNDHDGICFCVSKEGKRIFGEEYPHLAENQTCACSRQVHELREAGHIASLHCSPEGNYEPLQCDTESGLCYCVDPKTGRMTGAVLPESQWKKLPCFSLNYTNFNPEGGYLRMCESEWAPARKLAIEASLHGLQVLSGRRISCDFDGSYAPVQNMDGVTICVGKDGKQIADYRDSEDLYVTNCQCVRDEIRADRDSIPFNKICQLITGNYNMTSPFGGQQPQQWKCIDKDGMFFGDDNVVPESYKCCLEGDCSSEPISIQEKCADLNASESDNEGKYYPCSYYPQ